MTDSNEWPWCNVPVGWQALLTETIAALDVAAGPEGYVLDVVKAKFGGLDMLIQLPAPVDLEVHDATKRIVSDANRTFRTLCEKCGADAATVRIQGWYSTLCPAHQAAREADIASSGGRLSHSGTVRAPIDDVVPLLGDSQDALPEVDQ